MRNPSLLRQSWSLSRRASGLRLGCYPSAISRKLFSKLARLPAEGRDPADVIGVVAGKPVGGIHVHFRYLVDDFKTKARSYRREQSEQGGGVDTCSRPNIINVVGGSWYPQ